MFALPLLLFERSLMTLGEEGFADGDPTAAVTSYCLMGKGGDWLLVSGHLKVHFHGLLGRFCQ